MGFVDRFRRLEIPDDKRRVDWSFLDARASLPAPLPLAGEPLLVLADGRAWVPRERAAEGSEPRLILYREAHALEEIAGPAAAEAEWRARNAAELAREERRFLASVPTAVLREPALVDEGREILRLGVGDGAIGGDSAFVRLLGGARLLRLHGKLYDLVALREYVAIFERAIAPETFRFLQALPATVAPDEMLARIEERLADIHAKARSPLRNKMSTARAVIDGVTLLPIYREEAAGLFDAFARLFDRRWKLELLGRDR